jgi:hypothetical protein
LDIEIGVADELNAVISPLEVIAPVTLALLHGYQ